MCRNLNGGACNIYGAGGNCGEDTCGECEGFYDGENCENCKSGHYPVSGENGKVNQTTGEGVLCSGKVI